MDLNEEYFYLLSDRQSKHLNCSMNNKERAQVKSISPKPPSGFISSTRSSTAPLGDDRATTGGGGVAHPEHRRRVLSVRVRIHSLLLRRILCPAMSAPER